MPTAMDAHTHLGAPAFCRRRGTRGRRIGQVGRGDETIAPSRDRLHKTRRLGRVTERVAQPSDRRVQPVLEIDEGVLRPETLAELLASDELARLLEQHRQQEEAVVVGE